MEAIKENGRRMHEAQPVETAIANMVRRGKALVPSCQRHLRYMLTFVMLS